MYGKISTVVVFNPLKKFQERSTGAEVIYTDETNDILARGAGPRLKQIPPKRFS
jgi:hypothetical protein